MVDAAALKRKPVHRLAWMSFATALLALPLAWYGSLHAEKDLPQSPLRMARNANSSKPAEPGPLYERIWNKAETTIFGSTFDERLLALTERSRTARYLLEFMAFGLPFVLGITAAWLGATAMRAIEASRDNYLGNFQSVTAIMMGGFASVISGCMIISIYVWPYLPSLYTH